MTESLTIDINCDMGESFGRYSLGNDSAIMPYISSANIACGFHGGDPQVMAATVRLALAHGVAIGAHPGLPDLAGFGRRAMELTPKEIEAITVYQLGALSGFIRVAGGRLNHVKPHGALYNMACKDQAIAQSIARAVNRFDSNLILYGMAGSELVAAGTREGLAVAREVFVDRTYQVDGSLTPRQDPGALITNESDALKQLHRVIAQGKVCTVDGIDVDVKAETVCIHGDTPGALAFVQAIRQFSHNNRIAIKPVCR